MLPISENYINSVCEIKTPENRLLGTGILEKITEEAIQICKKDDTLPTLHCDTFVNVHIRHSSLGSKILVGKVFLSTSEMIRIIDVQNLTDFERRNFFRLRVGISTQAYMIKSQNEATPAGTNAQLFPVKLTNLSLSGCFVESKKKLEIGDSFSMSLPLDGARITLNCEIRRKPKSEGRYSGYGCVFLELTNRQSDLLCQYIFNKQREQIKTARKSPDYSE